MMNSTADDDFSPNPFRSDSGGGFGTPDPMVQTQQQQQFNQQQQFQQQQFQPQQQFQQQPHQQQQQNFQPQVGSDPFAPVPTHQFHQPALQPSFQAPMMSGTMDNKMEQSHLPPQQGQPTTWWGSCMMCISLDTYRAYFDIEADDIFARMKSALLDFYKPDYFRNQVLGPQKTDGLKGPDLYGPFWITMTLIFFVAVTGNVHAYLHRSDVERFEYDINHLLHAATILCSFAFVIPAVLWTTTQCLSMHALLLVEWVCIYGYSLVPFLPAVMICVIPMGIVSWVMLLLATLMSGCLVVRNVASPLLASDVGQAKAPPLILAILGIHLIFLFFMKFSFYHPHKK